MVALCNVVKIHGKFGPFFYSFFSLEIDVAQFLCIRGVAHFTLCHFHLHTESHSVVSCRMEKKKKRENMLVGGDVSH